MENKEVKIIYDLKDIMKGAWILIKELGYSKKEALKESWYHAKIGVYKIADWFIDKNFDTNCDEDKIIKYANSEGELMVIAETEKAIRFGFETDWGVAKKWVPKKAMMNCVAYAKRSVKADRENKAMEKGLEYNLKLVEYAKKAGLKARKKMKTDTLIKMIITAGLEVPAR